MKNNNSSFLFKNEKGQFLIEAVLLMVVSIGLLVAGLKILRDGNVISKLIDSPWEKAAGMIESGSWQKADAAAAIHPNQRMRSLSLDPERI